MVDLGQQSNDRKDDEETFHERHSTEQVLEEGEGRLGAINSKQPKCICDKDKSTNKRERERTCTTNLMGSEKRYTGSGKAKGSEMEIKVAPE